MQLGGSAKFAELYQRDGLAKLDALFVETLKATNIELFNRLMAARADVAGSGDKVHSQLLIDLAPHVKDFMGKWFGIETESKKLAVWHNELVPLYACKRLFVQRRAAKALKPEEAERLNAGAILQMLPIPPAEDEFFELAFAKTVMGWLEREAEHKSLLEMAARYAAWALYADAGRIRHANGILFMPPAALDFTQLALLAATNDTQKK